MEGVLYYYILYCSKLYNNILQCIKCGCRVAGMLWTHRKLLSSLTASVPFTCKVQVGSSWSGSCGNRRKAGVSPSC